MDNGIEDGENLYELLRIPNSTDSTAAEIRKAYRKRALESHPDKRPGDKNAAAEFDRIQKAYDVLGDEEARKAYDSLLIVRREREKRSSQQSEKRQKMVADLVAREQAFSKERNEEEAARSKLKAELERLRKQTADARRSKFAVPEPENSKTGATEEGLSEEKMEELSRTLKVTWSKSGGDSYPIQRIRSIFEEFGAVEDLVLRSGKKNKGIAMVVMSTQDSAFTATQSVCGDVSNPLLVVPAVLKPEANVSQSFPRPTQADPNKGAVPFPSNSSAAPSVIGTGYRDFESLTLMRMRQAAERAKLKKEMEEKDSQEDGAS